MRALFYAVALTAVTALFAACGPRYVQSTPMDPAHLLRPLASLTRHVVLVSIDGLRPDAIERFDAPTLQRLVREGSYSLSAQTILPSTTLPSHTSMLSGQPPEEHGILWNNVVSAKSGVGPPSTVFGVARSHGYRTAAFFSKAKFDVLQQPGTLDFSQAPGGWFGRWSSRRTVGDVRSYLASEQPNLLFVHLSDPDRAGHSKGWMSEAYGQAVAATDAALRDLLDAADAAYGPGNFSVVVTADHGGHGYGHGSSDPQDVTIPWIAWGRGIKAGALDNVVIDTVDTAPTVLWMLGVQEPQEWLGSPVVEAFQTPMLAATD